MEESVTLDTVRAKFDHLRPLMDERMRRQWAASEALALPRGGSTVVANATGLSRATIWAGVRELRTGTASGAEGPDPQRSRRPGGGRPFAEAEDPTLFRDLESLVDPV